MTVIPRLSRKTVGADLWIGGGNPLAPAIKLSEFKGKNLPPHPHTYRSDLISPTTEEKAREEKMSEFGKYIKEVRRIIREHERRQRNNGD